MWLCTFLPYLSPSALAAINRLLYLVHFVCCNAFLSLCFISCCFLVNIGQWLVLKRLQNILHSPECLSPAISFIPDSKIAGCSSSSCTGIGRERFFEPNNLSAICYRVRRVTNASGNVEHVCRSTDGQSTESDSRPTARFIRDAVIATAVLCVVYYRCRVASFRRLVSPRRPRRRLTVHSAT